MIAANPILPPPQPAGPRPRRPGSRRWPVIVVALLLGHMTLMAAAVAVATRHQSTLVVIPDYYRHATHWDAEQAQRRASDRLGWRLSFTASDRVDPVGNRAVVFALTDAAGRPVAGADIKVTYFHHARAADRAELALRTDDAGTAGRAIQMRNEGFWEVSLTATTRDGKKFLWTGTPYVANARAKRVPS